MSRQPRFDAPRALSYVSGGFYRRKIFREQEEDIQGMAIILSAGVRPLIGQGIPGKQVILIVINTLFQNQRFPSWSLFFPPIA